MEWDEFDASLREQLSDQLAGPLRSYLEEADAMGAVCTCDESCRVVEVTLPADLSSVKDLEDFIRSDSEIWHHQLKLDGEPVLYARSLVTRQGENPCVELLELVKSRVAQCFDDTLAELEQMEGQEGTVRLLTVPLYNEEFFALFVNMKIAGVLPLLLRSEWSVRSAVRLGLFDPTFILERLTEVGKFLGLRSSPIPPIDLTLVTEETRRALYDAVVEIHFRSTSEEVRRAMEDPENHWVPTYGPEEAGLVVYYDRGRWYAAWRPLEEGPDVAPELRWTVLRIVADPDSPLGGLGFLEV